MECMELKICMSDKHHRYYKHTKCRQNPRGDLKFLVDLTWNDPYARMTEKEYGIMELFSAGSKEMQVVYEKQ